MNTQNWKPNGISTEDYFHLLSQYYDELKHRDTMFWKQAFAYFYAIVIFSILPVLKPFGLEIPETIPKMFFPVFGIAMSLCFLFVSLAYSKRLKCINDSYKNMLKDAPEAYPWKSLKGEKTCKVYEWQMAKTVSWIMFILLSGLNIFIWIFS